MGATTGIVAQGDYTTPGTDALKVQALIDMIPNPDATPGTGAVAGGSTSSRSSYLDDMNASTCAALRVEFLALKAAVT